MAVERLTYSLREPVDASGGLRQTIYHRITAGRIRAVRLRKRLAFTGAELERILYREQVS